MTPELWQRLKSLFHAALEKNAEERDAFVSVACGGDVELKSHLKKLLDAEAQSTGSFGGPLAAVADFFPGSGTRFQDEEMVLGRFRIIRLIGRGGMGEVYEAEDLQLGRIALKTVRREIALSPGAFERFRQEVLLARKITGPQVCRIHEMFLLPPSDGHEATVFLTMEYLDGVTLASRLAKDGPLPWKEALPAALDLCEGLRLIHAEGIIHRDFKCGNIMLCAHGKGVRTVLMDFGLAQDFEAGNSGSRNKSIYSDGAAIAPRIVGTPEYMAPEQFEGGAVSPATDIYSLGIVLYEMVTGVHPYAGPTPIAAAIRRARHPASPSAVGVRVPAQLDRVIGCCLEYEPAKRFQSAEEVAQALRPGPANLRYLHRDRPWVFRAVCALVLAAVAWGVYHLWQTRHYYRPSLEARRWYGSGVAALREGNYVKATRSLQAALAEEPHYVMAHARLAEAWEDLDFHGNAQQEMLTAAPDARRLAPLDRMYMEAIQATVTHDYARGVEDYKRILGRLPPEDKAAGYVDLGMAYERALDYKGALENYSTATKRDSGNPASFLHTAILQSRLNHVPEAEKAFQRADALFTAEMNQEGLAELDYWRGYAANSVGNSKEAIHYLQQSLDEADRISSGQLQIRALSQLSSAVVGSDTSRAAGYAQQAIRLARGNQLDAWAADGLVRLADAQMRQGNFQSAEDTLQEALQLARQTEQPRVEAFANLGLANLMNQRHLPDQVIAPAQSALDYYNKIGYLTKAAQASLLLIRSQRDKGQYKQALESSNTFLDLANKSGIQDLNRQAEEVIGTVRLEMEQYPEALTHFEKARSLADAASAKNEAAHSADVLWRLGRYGESDAMLRFEPVSENLSNYREQVRIESLLSRGNYREALSSAQQIVTTSTKLTLHNKQELALNVALAESRLGMKQRALDDLRNLETQYPTHEDNELATRELASAEIKLSAGQAQQAHDAAAKAAQYFASNEQLDSDLRSVCLAAAAAKMLKNKGEYDEFSKKAVDISGQIQQTWSPQVTQTYFSRPDIRTLLRQVPLATAPSRR